MTSAEERPEARLDALLPSEMAANAEEIGVRKTLLPFDQLFTLAFLAGAFIALGAIFATTVATGGSELPYGVNRLLTGVAFSLGLILVIVGGAELFTGNNLIIMAWASRKVKTPALLRNWAIVYVGNFAGAVATAAVMLITQQYGAAGGALGETALAIGHAKCRLGVVDSVALGAMCNVLVCLAVWLAFSARTTADRILAIVPPIAAFVAAGFEHSIANMYFIPIALFIKRFADDGFWTSIGKTPADYPDLTWLGLAENLIPVTIGNIVGGAFMVGAVYWFVYLRPRKK